jgi:hypothetical protein
MESLSDILGLMIFGALAIFIALNKTARSIISNSSLPGMLAKTRKQEERVEARTRLGFLIAGIVTVFVACIFLVRHLLSG